MDIYVIHYKKMIDRKEYLSSIFPDAIWLDMYERETINLDECKIYEANNSKLWFERIEGIYKDLPKYRELSKAEICNSLSHIKALELLIESDEPYGLVLEDDVIPSSDFHIELKKIIEDLPEDFDLIFLGSSYGVKFIESITLNTIPIKIESNQRIYKKIPPLTRTVDSYLISLKAAKKLYENIDKIVHPYDWDLPYFFKKLNFNVYWCEPGVTQQGSSTGKYASSLR